MSTGRAKVYLCVGLFVRRFICASIQKDKFDKALGANWVQLFTPHSSLWSKICVTFQACCKRGQQLGTLIEVV
jgi:hypothetical protein